MKKAISLLVFLTFSLTTSPIQAAENWVIEEFDAKIAIQEVGTVRVIETIKVDFAGLSKHGIFRDLPYIYKDSDSVKRYTEIDLESVNRDGNTEKYATSRSNGYFQIKIGDENTTISGSHTYDIIYTVTGVLESYETFDEFYWNSTGNYWEVPINHATATVSLPTDGIQETACYQGVVGSKETCLSTFDSPTNANFATTRKLNPGEGLTIAVGYTKGLLPILTGSKPKEVTDDLFSFSNIAIFGATLLIGILAVFYLWYQKGRDFWFRSRFLNDLQARHEARPLGGHETVVVEFTPPDNLRPGEIGALLDENVQNIEITATIVDLANRGYLKNIEKPKKWMFGTNDYVFNQLKKSDPTLLNYEQELLDRIFEKGQTIALSDLKNKFYKHLNGIKDRLYSHLVRMKFFEENPSFIRMKYLIVGIVISVCGGVLIWFGFLQIVTSFISFGAAIVLVGIFMMIFSQFMPRKTAAGRAMFVRVKGYRMFIERAEKYRQQFFEKKNLFNEILPYAIVFGITEKFAKAFKDMGIEPEKPNWYSGSATFNAAIFGASMASFTNSFSSTIASSPSSSGSSGGGFSGGGFGGGGGGSW